MVSTTGSFSKYILGISCYYHDSSATLIKNGVIVSAVQEERFTRVKHDSSFPINAINYCLENEGISGGDLYCVVFYEKPLLKFERFLFQHVENFPRTWKVFVKYLPDWINSKLRIRKHIRKLGYRNDILFVGHHMSHISSFLLSPFYKSAIVSVDGVGEWSTTVIGVGEGNVITPLKELKFPHSLGLLYSTITAYLGFRVNNSEYKVMGLSAYGDTNRKTNKYYNKLKRVITIRDDGSYNLDMSYFKYHYSDRMPSEKLCILLGGSVRKPEDIVEQRHKDIAAAIQMVYEDALFAILNYAHKLTKCDNLVLSGGCGLNSVANGKILSNTEFKSFWAQPDPGDGGGSMGAAVYVWSSILGNNRMILDNPYLGPKFSNISIKSFLLNAEINFSEFSSDAELVKTVAKLLKENNVVGWFQGGMEWGPRALGARSILSNAQNPEMQDILNLKVKHREKFRPFAPVVCFEDVKKYFVCDSPVPDPTDFMLMVYPVKKQFWKKIPAVVHVDKTGRLQSVKKEQNPLYHSLIKEFGRISGIPILINTSFNIRGEPIVCTPMDAYKCMMGTGIDYLVIGKFLVKRSENLKDAWDSEANAKEN